jgi:hypothetical protein
MATPPHSSRELSPATRELLAWLSIRPRGYAETMEAWGTHCPRLAAWEDALASGLVEVRRNVRESAAQLTPRGRAELAAEPQ